VGETAKIYFFVLIMTVVVALVLAGMNTGLKSIHEQNEAIFNKKAVLAAIQSQLGEGVKAADIPDEEVQQIFENNITQLVVDHEGQAITTEAVESRGYKGGMAEHVDMKKEKKRDLDDRYFPVYIYESGSDNPSFPRQFQGKSLYDKDGNFTSVVVKKGGARNPRYEVDGISGATVTCDGVSDMLFDGIKNYMPYFNKASKSKERKLLTDPLNDNNPITVQVLGICSALAVTTLLVPSIVISVAVIFVCAFSNLFTSLLRKSIPKQVRMIVQLVIIATLVTVVELTLKAVDYNIYKQLSIFIGLIITNCIVMGRLEAFAMANSPWKSFLDGVGNGVGYGVILIIVAFFRELFGKGSLLAGSPLEMKIIGSTPEYWINTAAESGIGTWFSWYSNNNLMVLPAAAMFLIAILIWVHRTWNPKLVDIS